MQVSAVSSAIGSQLSQVNQSVNNQAFGRRAVLSDDEIQEVALRASVQKAKKRQQNTNRLFLAVPVVAALSAGILHKGNAKVLNKEISGAAGKLITGLKAGGSWMYLLGLATAIGATNAAISRKSEKYAEFRRNNFLLSFVGDIATFGAACLAIPLGASKLASKIKPKHLESFANGIENVASHYNNIMKKPEFIKNLSNGIAKRIPQGVKDAQTSVSNAIPQKAKDIWNGTKEIGKGIGKVALSWAPEVTLLTGLFSQMTSNLRFVDDYNSNYAKLKERFGGNSEA